MCLRVFTAYQYFTLSIYIGIDKLVLRADGRFFINKNNQYTLYVDTSDQNGCIAGGMHVSSDELATES